MARTTHLHQRHRGLIPDDQLASATPTAGDVPIADGAGSQAWTALNAAAVPFTPAGSIAATNVQTAIEEAAAEAGGGGGSGGWEVVSTDGTKLEAGRTRIWDTAEDGSIILDGSITFVAGTGFGIELEMDPGEVAEVGGDGLVLPSHTSDPTAFGDGQLIYRSDTDAVRARVNGAWVSLGTGGGIPSGTSNPGSPSTGDLFHRTDLSPAIYRYNGTRWLCTCPHIEAIAPAETLMPLSGSSNIGYAQLDNSALDLWIEKIICSTTVVTTNDGTKFWTVAFQRGPSATALGSFTTSADTANTNVRHDIAVNALAGTSDRYINGGATKTSTPGNIYALAQIKFYYVAP